MQQSAFLDYYRSIVDDVDALSDAIHQPLPMTFWVNPLKASPADVQALLEQSGFTVKPLPWHEAAFQVDDGERLGKSWQYLAGLVQIQEAVSMLPVSVLQPQPGESVLDLCAAPGNKTAEAAVAMQNTGTIVANDTNYGRLRAMGQIIKRLGLINISLSVCDAAKLPKVQYQFDKIIADVPCSCEGTLRKHKDRVVVPSRDFALKMARRQKAILARAVQLCRPGGRIVYSTCTFAPEENEAVVSDILHRYAGQLKVVPITVPHFTFSPGITEWYSDHYHPDVVNTMRVWPHQNNTGGFYVALLEKVDTSLPLEQIYKLDYQSSPPQALEAVNERFGLPNDCWKSFQFSKGSKKGYYLTTQDHQPPRFKYDATGLFFLKMKTEFPKLSTAVVMLLGRQATKNVIEITDSAAYFARETIVLTEAQIQQCTGTGYVVVFYQGYPIGMGLYLSAKEDRPHRLQSLFPKYLG